jgi:hypothetical protein
MLANFADKAVVGGVAAPLAMGWVAATRLAGDDRGFTILAGLLLAGGLIGLLFIGPEDDRKWLARHAVTSSAVQPARG